jgi:hypothetical protein
MPTLTEKERKTTEVQQLRKAEREERIRKRAHELYVQRGRVSGFEIDDWRQAEFEVWEAQLQEE